MPKNGADQDTLKQLGENVDEAKRKFNENPSQAAIASAETNFRNTIKEMADNYIKYGSSEKDKTSPNERKEKLKNIWKFTMPILSLPKPSKEGTIKVILFLKKQKVLWNCKEK